MSDQTIPVLSLADYTAGGPVADRFATRLGHALEEYGFFALVDHQIPGDLIRRAYAAAEEFFLLPDEVKLRYELPELKGQRGFTRFGREHARDHPAPDLKEFWHVGRWAEPESPLPPGYPENLWPDEVPDFRPALSELYRRLDDCSMVLLEAVSRFLGETPGRLPEAAAGGNSIVRVIHYPPVPPGVNPASLRAAPHEDINLITLLCEATAGGLEIQTRSGRWLPVRTLPGQVIVDAGDMLQNLTNGLLRSTTHRVTNPEDDRERRFSMPFFVHPRSEVDLTPLPGCVQRTGGVARFPRITAGEYLEQRLREIGLA